GVRRISLDAQSCLSPRRSRLGAESVCPRRGAPDSYQWNESCRECRDLDSLPLPHGNHHLERSFFTAGRVPGSQYLSGLAAHSLLLLANLFLSRNDNGADNETRQHDFPKYQAITCSACV